MINQSLIQNLPAKTGFLKNFITSDFSTVNYNVKLGTVSGYWELYSKTSTALMGNDSKEYITNYAKNLLTSNYSSILFGGLGLGTLPYLSQDLTATVNVVEIEQEIIDLTSGIGHLSSNVNLIQGNIFTFNTEQTYDIILIDIWNIQDFSIINPQVSTLTAKYAANLNEGGVMYYPILEW